MARDQLIAWLNDAYGMEQSQIPVLEHHAKDADREMPQAAGRIRQHIDETRRHAERVEQCLRQLGTSPSAVKSTLSSLMGNVQSATTGFFEDGPVRNAIADYGAEQFEVASYEAIAAAARELGHAGIATICEENMREDRQMADWFHKQLPVVVKRSVSKTAAAR